MKKFFLISLAVVFIGTSIFSQDYDIRKLKWGMPYNKVKEIEKLGDTFYKEEELLGMRMEVLFGCGINGLYSVTYSAINSEFVDRLTPVLIKKYGEPTIDLDYSFLMESKDIFKRHPKAVVDILEKNDFSELNQIEEYSNIDEKKIIKGGLIKRKVWEYGNTNVFLLNSMTGGVLSYRPKALQLENKKKFNSVLVEIKKLAKEAASSSGDVF